jgi:hypothetical protein
MRDVGGRGRGGRKTRGVLLVSFEDALIPVATTLAVSCLFLLFFFFNHHSRRVVATKAY